MVDKTISKVVKDNLCTGCGSCIAVCPKEAIKLTLNINKGIYTPKVNWKKCNECNICFKICPGHEVNSKQLNLEIFGKQPNNYLIGNYLNCYIGHSNNQDIRRNSSSGGLITQLLIFALEEGIIDGALVTRMKKDDPYVPEPFIARTKEEIIEASQSKYCPVPANIALKEILKSNDKEKFAVVGLPCHITGIKKIESINKKLKDKIHLHLGIFCSHTASFKDTEFLLYSLGIEKENVKLISYRGNGWPGKIKIQLKNRKEIYVSNQDSIWNSIFNNFFFTPNRCLFCNDLTVELSDISFGDPWLPEIMAKEQTGKSIVISRTNNGAKLLNLAISKGYLNLSSIDSNKIIESQQTFLHFKKNNLYDRIRFKKMLGKFNYPISDPIIKNNYYNKILMVIPLFNNYLGTKFGFLYKYVPFKIFEIQLKLLYSLYSLAMDDDFYEK